MTSTVGSMPCSALMRSAMATKSKPFQSPGTQKNSAPVWATTNPTSRSRYIGRIGFCTAPRRASASDSTTVSMRVGQLPGHPGAVADAHGLQAGGDPLGAVAQTRRR